MPRPSKPRWKYRELIVALGGSRGVAEHLAARGVAAPSAKIIQAWMHRSSVPGAYAPLLILIGLETKIISDINALRRGNAA